MSSIEQLSPEKAESIIRLAEQRKKDVESSKTKLEMLDKQIEEETTKLVELYGVDWKKALDKDINLLMTMENTLPAEPVSSDSFSSFAAKMDSPVSGYSTAGGVESFEL